MKYFSISFVLIVGILAGTGCESAPERLEKAQTAFAEKVWEPFLKHDRCNNCHDYDNLYTGFVAGHPDKNGNCVSCHSSAVLGFATPTWHLPPAADKWNKNSDPNVVRDHLLSGATAGTGLDLYKHLLGEGADQQPLVQWGFFNGPDTTANGGVIKAGAVPAGGPNSGQIASNKLLDWEQYKTNVQEWLCLEGRAGNNNLGLPNNVNCFGILFCGTAGLTSTIATFCALACIVTVRRIRRRRR